MVSKSDCEKVKGKWENTSCVYTLDTIRMLKVFEQRSFVCPNIRAFQQQMMKSFGIVPVSVDMAWEKYINPMQEITPEYSKDVWYPLPALDKMRATHAYYQKQLDERVEVMLQAVRANLC